MAARCEARGAPLRRPPAAAAPARIAEVEIASIAAGGDGVGRTESLVVFVPRTAPGDLARVRLTSRGRFARGVVESIVRPSPRRVEPPCPHYVADRCGGCQLQHLAYGAQLEAKAGMVRDALARIGRRELPAPAVEPSPGEWRYRRKLTLALRWNQRWIMGLHAYDDPDRVFDLRDCPITDERVVAVWREVRAAASLLPRVRALRGSVRLLDDGAAFVLEGGERWPVSDRFFAAVPGVSALWWAPEGKSRRLLHDRRAHAEPGAAFAQVNAAMATRLHAYVVERAMAHAPTTAVDGYSGAGATAIALAGRGVRVMAIELDRDAAHWTAGHLPEGSRSLTAAVEDALPDALPADVVLLNPPRAGVHERVTATLAAAAPRPRAIVYVSCSPPTLARDLARLPGWRVASLQSFDMFPQTAHVETVCELVPEVA